MSQSTALEKRSPRSLLLVPIQSHIRCRWDFLLEVATCVDIGWHGNFSAEDTMAEVLQQLHIHNH